MELSQRIAAIRKELKLSQEKFGELVNMSQRSVAAWESGERTPSFATLSELADRLSVSVDWLIGRTDEKVQIKNPAVPEDDGLKSMIISQVQTLSEPALVRLSDFLSGLEAGQEIAAQQGTDPGSAAGSDPSPLPPDPPGSSL